MKDYITDITKYFIETTSTIELSTKIEKTFMRHIDANNLKFFVLTKGEYINQFCLNEKIEKTHPIVEILFSQHRFLSYLAIKNWAKDLKTNTFKDLDEFCKSKNIAYILPLFFGGLVGFITIGDKKSKEFYGQNDFKIFELVMHSSSIAIQNINLLTDSTKDDLTGLYVRKFFEERLKEYIGMSMKHNMNFCVLFLDIDNFKNLNDTLGHLRCNEKLQEFSSLLKNSIRNEDVGCRWGGEEFVVLLKNVTKDDGFNVASKILKKVENSMSITLSCGLEYFDYSRYKKHSLDEILKTIICEADKKMYLAKQNGKNQIIT